MWPGQEPGSEWLSWLGSRESPHFLQTQKAWLSPQMSVPHPLSPWQVVPAAADPEEPIAVAHIVVEAPDLVGKLVPHRPHEAAQMAGWACRKWGCRAPGLPGRCGCRWPGRFPLFGLLALPESSLFAAPAPQFCRAWQGVVGTTALPLHSPGFSCFFYERGTPIQPL